MVAKQSENQDAELLSPWEQQPDEPDYWYGRFKIFLGCGPARSVVQAYQTFHLDTYGKLGRSGGKWHTHANKWHWRERANAWDTYQRELYAFSERDLRLGLRNRRVAVMEDTLEVIRAALDRAEIEDIDREKAREWLPQMRVFLRDMLVAERQEFEKDDYTKQDASTLTITVDDLRAAQRALEPPKLAPLVPEPNAPGLDLRKRPFLVCVGSDYELMLDLAALRAVRAATGLGFHRLLTPTRRKLSQTLNRERRIGHPFEYVHFALHASPQGLELDDGPVDGNWLSERLAGVRVVMLASCESTTVGDWLGVVPHVISLSENITNEDAAVLTQHFWQGIGLGMEPPQALDEALIHCPPVVSEYVIRHW